VIFARDKSLFIFTILHLLESGMRVSHQNRQGQWLLSFTGIRAPPSSFKHDLDLIFLGVIVLIPHAGGCRTGKIVGETSVKDLLKIEIPIFLGGSYG
jgi:hypothetical protein